MNPRWNFVVAALVATATLAALSPMVGASLISDCTRPTGTSPTFVWNDPIGVDYYQDYEAHFVGAPLGSVQVDVTEQCKINGFSVLANTPSCPHPNPCIKFWSFQRTVSMNVNEPGPLSIRTCTIHLHGPSGQTDIINLDTYPAVGGVQCQGYCEQGRGDCVLGRTVSSHIKSILRYDFEAPDLPSMPGAVKQTEFFANSRDNSNANGVENRHTHTTCQYGTPQLVTVATLANPSNC